MYPKARMRTCRTFVGRRLYSHEVEEFFGVHVSSDEDDTPVYRRPLFSHSSLDTVIEVQT
jgi:hypothetical protein